MADDRIADIARGLEWEKVESGGYANGNRSCFGRCRVSGGWIYEFSRWESSSGHSSWGVFVPDSERTNDAQ